MNNNINFDLVSDLYDSYVNVNIDIPFLIGETSKFDDEILELMCGTGRDSDTGIVSGFQLYEVYDASGNLTEKRTLEINFKPVSDPEFKKLIIRAGMEVFEIYGDYSKNGFIEENSDFMICKLRKKSISL